MYVKCRRLAQERYFFFFFQPLFRAYLYLFFSFISRCLLIIFVALPSMLASPPHADSYCHLFAYLVILSPATDIVRYSMIHYYYCWLSSLFRAIFSLRSMVPFLFY